MPLWNGIWGKLLLLSCTEIILSLIGDFWVFFRPISRSRLRDVEAGNQAPQKSPPEFMLQALVDKSSCFSFSCDPRQLPKPSTRSTSSRTPKRTWRTFTIFTGLVGILSYQNENFIWFYLRTVWLCFKPYEQRGCRRTFVTSLLQWELFGSRHSVRPWASCKRTQGVARVYLSSGRND